jgi:hypothetical protein
LKTGSDTESASQNLLPQPTLTQHPRLGVQKEDLLEGAYMDLFEKKPII